MTKKANKSAKTAADQTETIETKKTAASPKKPAAAKTESKPATKTASKKMTAESKKEVVKTVAEAFGADVIEIETAQPASSSETANLSAIPENGSGSAIPETENFIHPGSGETIEVEKAQTVFKFDKQAGKIGEIRLTQAAQELNDQFGDTAGEMLLSGSQLFNELGDWYSLDGSKLQFCLDKLEKERAAGAGGAELLGNEGAGAVDDSIEYDKDAQAAAAASVDFPEIIDAETDNETKNGETARNPENSETGDNPGTALAVVGSDEVIDGIVTEQLSDEEQKRRAELEEAIKIEQPEHLRTSFVIGACIDELLEKKLYRSTHSSVELYVWETFGFSREYAYQLQGAAKAVAALKSGNHSEQKLFSNSVNTMFYVHRRTKQIAKAAGLSETELQAQLNLLTNIVYEIAEETAPQDDNGKPILTTRHVNNVAEVVKDFLKSGGVEMDGKQFPLSVAGQTVGSLAVDAHTAQTTYEQINTHKDRIREDIKNRTDRMKSGNPKREAVDGGGAASADAKTEKKEKADVPILETACSEHGAVAIDALLPGRIVLSCGCAHENIEGEGIVCVQVAGEIIRRTKPAKDKK